MRITPLVQHACARLPQLTDYFSNVVQADISATPGATTDIVCHEPHNLNIGDRFGVCVRKAKSQVPIVNAVLADGAIELEFDRPHGLVNNATAIGVNSWNADIELTGFTDPLMNNSHEFITKLDDKRCLIKSPESADVSLTGSAAMLDERNDYFNGWQPVLVVDGTTLRKATNPLIDTVTNVSNVTVATNIRAWGALDYSEIHKLYSSKGAKLKEVSLSVSPLGVVPVSKDRNTKTSAISELNNSTVMRQTVMDGFHVVATVPTADTRGAVDAADLCHGELLDAVIRTFQGYKPPLPDLEGVDPFVAVLKQHGGLSFDRAFYSHEYQFEASYTLSNLNALKATEQTSNPQLETTDPLTVGPAHPVGSTPINDLHFDGIFNGELGQPLTASIQYEDNT